jgi:NitT/TauT family transport system permease protein
LAKILVALFLIGITLSVYQGVLELSGVIIRRAWTGK